MSVYDFVMTYSWIFPLFFGIFLVLASFEVVKISYKDGKNRGFGTKSWVGGRDIGEEY